MPRRVSLYWSGPLLLGLGQDETPAVTAPPWEKPSQAELEAKAKAEYWSRFSQAVGLLGGVVGLVLGVKALLGSPGNR